MANTSRSSGSGPSVVVTTTRNEAGRGSSISVTAPGNENVGCAHDDAKPSLRAPTHSSLRR